MPIPAVPEGFLPETAEKWRDYWLSDMAVVIDMGTDYDTVERYFRLKNEELLAYQVVEQEGRTVAGSQGQPVEHPMLRYVSRIQGEMRQIADRIGLSPRSKAQLGIAIKRAVRDLEQRSQEVQMHDGVSDAGDRDPRLA